MMSLLTINIMDESAELYEAIKIPWIPQILVDDLLMEEQCKSVALEVWPAQLSTHVVEEVSNHGGCSVLGFLLPLK